MNKKGFVIELIIFTIIGIFAIVFFAAWMYGSNLVNTSLINIDTGDNQFSNISYATSNTFSYVNSGYTTGLPVVAFFLLLGYMVASLIVAYYGRNHPLMLACYLIAVIIITIFSFYVSNAYDDIKHIDILSGSIASFGIADYFVSYLPYFVLVVGLGCVLLGYVLYAKEGGSV